MKSMGSLRSNSLFTNTFEDLQLEKYTPSLEADEPPPQRQLVHTNFSRKRHSKSTQGAAAANGGARTPFSNYQRSYLMDSTPHGSAGSAASLLGRNRVDMDTPRGSNGSVGGEMLGREHKLDEAPLRNAQQILMKKRHLSDVSTRSTGSTSSLLHTQRSYPMDTTNSSTTTYSMHRSGHVFPYHPQPLSNYDTISVFTEDSQSPSLENSKSLHSQRVANSRFGSDADTLYSDDAAAELAMTEIDSFAPSHIGRDDRTQVLHGAATYRTEPVFVQPRRISAPRQAKSRFTELDQGPPQFSAPSLPNNS